MEFLPANNKQLIFRLADAVALLTIVSKLHFLNGLVRISAGMVGILLN